MQRSMRGMFCMLKAANMWVTLGKEKQVWISAVRSGRKKNIRICE